MNLALSELASTQSGYQPRGAVVDDPNGTHLLLQMRNLPEHGPVDWGTLARITPERLAQPYLLSEGDVLLQVRGVKHRAVALESVPTGALASNHFYILRADRSKICPGYLAWYINQPEAQRHLERGSQTSGSISLLTRDVFESLSVPVPPIEKQIHIAAVDCLLDEQRALTMRLMEAWDRYQAAMSLWVANGGKLEREENNE